MKLTEASKRELRRLLNEREDELRVIYNRHLGVLHAGALTDLCCACEGLQAQLREVLYLRRTHCPSKADAEGRHIG